jgi:PKD repeat protein
MKNLLVLLFLWLSVFQNTKAQVFGQPYQACPENPILFSSPNPNNNLKHAWDFATGDLLGTPEAAVVNSFIQFTWRPETIKIVKDGDNWYGFIVNTGYPNILRANFGNSLDNIPTFTQLGNLSCALLGTPYNLFFQKENGIWYGIFCIANGYILKVTFGSSLDNLAPTCNIVIPPGDGAALSGELVKDELINKWYWVSPAFTQATGMRIYDFGSSLANLTTGTLVNTIPNTGGFSVSVCRDNGNWYTPFSFLNQRWGMINFGNSLTNANPAITLYSSGSPTPVQPVTVNFYYHKMVRDGLNWIGFGIASNGTVYRWNYGTSLNNIPTAQILGNFGVLGVASIQGNPSLGWDIVKEESTSTWYIFAINRNFNDYNASSANRSSMVRLRFPNVVNSEIVTSNSIPVTNKFFNTGLVTPELKIFNSDNTLINHYADTIRIKDAAVGKFTLQKQCLGQTTQFINLTTGNTNNITQILWEFGNGQTSTLPNPTYQYPTAGNYEVKLTVLNNNSCTNTYTQNIRVSKYPKANFNIKQIDCNSGTIDLEDLSSISAEEIAQGGRIVQRIWSFGDGTYWQASPINTTYIRKGLSNIPSTDGNTPFLASLIPFIAGQKYIISLTITDDAGCSSTISKTVSFLESDKPIPNFTNALACAGVPTSFIDTSTLPTNAIGEISKWKWRFKNNMGVVIDSTNFQNPFYTFVTAGNYQVELEVQNSNGCKNSIVKNIVVNNSLISQFQTSTNGGFAPLQVSFTNQNNSANSYFWDFGNGMISTQANPIITFTNAGTYLVKYQARNTQGCGTIATQIITVGNPPTSLENLSNSPIKISPNPFLDKIMIEKDNNERVEIVIFDVLGKELERLMIQDLKNELYLNHLASGTYILKIKQNTKEWVQKIIKK